MHKRQHCVSFKELHGVFIQIPAQWLLKCTLQHSRIWPLRLSWGASNRDLSQG